MEAKSCAIGQPLSIVGPDCGVNANLCMGTSEGFPVKRACYVEMSMQNGRFEAPDNGKQVRMFKIFANFMSIVVIIICHGLKQAFRPQLKVSLMT